jgi:hypothetical protein
MKKISQISLIEQIKKLREPPFLSLVVTGIRMTGHKEVNRQQSAIENLYILKTGNKPMEMISTSQPLVFNKLTCPRETMILWKTP